MLTETNYSGIPSVGIDLNPVACLISRVKTNLLPNPFLETGIMCAKNANSTISIIPKNEIPNLNHWFKPEDASIVIMYLLKTNKILYCLLYI